MPKNDNGINEKLEYIGLDLNNIPSFLKSFKPLDYRPYKNYDEKIYRVYKYVNVKDIEILLTPTNRLSDIKDRYSKAVPVKQYIFPQSENDIERHAIFLKMLNNITITEIEKISKEQELLNKKIPFKVKSHTNYLWQIYYSEFTNQYFMLVPIEDLEYSAFFYLLKKQLEAADYKIFVPICYMDYSGEILKKSEIEDISNYMWLFTKNWPLVYEVYDKYNKLSLQITGETICFENIKSDYNIKLATEEEAIKFYKLLKALFIMQTELPHCYKFITKLDEKAKLEFYFDLDKITYDNLPLFIKKEYGKIVSQEIDILSSKLELEKRLEKIKKEFSTLDKEYLLKERQIATYLEYKKTFFGKIKYFLKKKEFLKKENINKPSLKNNTTQNDTEEFKIKIEERKYYTLEDLIDKCKEIDNITSYIKNLKLDIEAGDLRNKNIKNKIKNATLFIEEIDNHTKSIFEFWRFTNKDKVQKLIEPEQVKENRIKKVFNLEDDFEDFAKELDKRQRNILSKEELNSIFLLSTDMLYDINKAINGEKIADEKVEKLKSLAIEEKRLLENENFDIFGGIDENKNIIKNISNKRHRENARSKFNILDVADIKESEEYARKLEKVIYNIDESLNKISTSIGISIYKLTVPNQELEKRYNIFNINPINTIKDLEKLQDKELNLYKINLKEDSLILGFTNIIYYENTNYTLPLGMDIYDKILIDKSLLKLKLNKKSDFNIVIYKDDKLSEIEIKKINVIEYDAK